MGKKISRRFAVCLCIASLCSLTATSFANFAIPMQKAKEGYLKLDTVGFHWSEPVHGTGQAYMDTWQVDTCVAKPVEDGIESLCKDIGPSAADHPAVVWRYPDGCSENGTTMSRHLITGTRPYQGGLD